jgi:uncharacterized metal-binding protein
MRVGENGCQVSRTKRSIILTLVSFERGPIERLYMPDYKTHSTFNLCLALPILVVGAYYGLRPDNIFLYLFIGTYVYCTLFMSPDMDFANKIKLMSLRGFLTLPFRSYSMVFSHRGISHSVFFGSLTRIVWLAALGMMIFFLIYQALPSEKSIVSFYQEHKLYFFYVIAAICLADWSHLLLDLKESK